MNIRELVTGEIGSAAWLKAVAKLVLTVAVVAVLSDMALTGYSALRAAAGIPAYEVVSVQHGGAVVVLRERSSGTFYLCSLDGECEGRLNVAEGIKRKNVSLENVISGAQTPPPPPGFVVETEETQQRAAQAGND